MRFQNLTPFPAFLHREAIARDRIAAAAILRATFDLGSPCRASLEQPWLVMPTPWIGPAGPMETDASFDRQGCDLLLFGDAQTPDSSKVEALDVTLTVGEVNASVRVTGDRVWVREGDKLVPSSPAPFARIPLDLDHAYGGTALFDELEVPFTDNPKGKGFYLEEAEAEGKPLPNLEDPAERIATWSEQPEPAGVGLCPRHFSGRVKRGVVVRDNQVVGVTSAIQNVAFPRFIAPSVQPGTSITLRGMGPDLTFSLPADEIVATTRVGEVEHRDVARIDQIGIEPAHRRLFVTYRHTFIYPLREGELRRCELRWKRPGALKLATPLENSLERI
jgi:hypothetical protein